MLLGSLVALLGLATLIFEDPNPTTSVQLKVFIPRAEAIVFFIAYLILSAGTLFTLMRPATKAFFTSQTNLEDKQ